MMSRLSKIDAQLVKAGLVAAVSKDVFVHSDQLPRKFGDIWISERQKQEYLRRLADAGLIRVEYHSRGWYSWNTYSARIDPMSVRKVYDAYYQQYRYEGGRLGWGKVPAVVRAAQESYMHRDDVFSGWRNWERHNEFCQLFYSRTGNIHPTDPIPF